MAGTRDDNLIKVANPNAVVGQTYDISGRSVVYGGTDIPSAAEQDKSATQSTSTVTIPRDSRLASGAGKYPNQEIKKTSSGHTIIYDDSKGAEHVTIQHRKGSQIQFQADGNIVLTAHGNNYRLIFGNDTIVVTGRQDVIIQGSATMKVDGDYDMTVQGNMTTTVQGNYVLAAKNMTQQINGDVAVAAKNIALDSEGNSFMKSRGITAITTDGGLSLSSTADSVAIESALDMGLKAGRSMMIESMTSTHLLSATAMNLETSNKLSLKAQTIAGDGGPNIQWNEGASVSADPAKVSFKAPRKPTKEPDVPTNRASGA